MEKVTLKDILRANAWGLKHKRTEGSDYQYWSYFTPVLMAAYQAGRENGIDLSGCPVVSGYRYGKMPEGGISVNYRDNYSENGLSMAKIDGAEECRSVVWFSSRKKVNYSGLLLPYTGSDGEALILPIGSVENLDA